jgi:hypothetical protein
MRTLSGPFAAVLMIGCLGLEPVAEERAESRIGEEATCDPAQAGCWHEADREVLAAIAMQLDEAGAVPLESRSAAVCRVAQEIRGRLGHKLTYEQADALAVQESISCAGGPRDEIAITGDAASILAQPLLSLELDASSAYTEVASLAPQDGAVECPSCAGALRWPGWGWVPEEWPAGVRTALLSIASAQGAKGTVGRAYVAFLVMNGVWDTDFVQENARLFGTSTLTRDEQLDRIEADAASKARWIGGLSGALVSGGFLAMTVSGPLGASVGAFGIAHRGVRIHLLRLRTALRTAAVFGHDPTSASTVDLAISLSINGGTLLDQVLATGFETGTGLLTFMALMRYADSAMLALFGNPTVTAEVVVMTLGSLLTVGIGAAVGAAAEHLLNSTYCGNLEMAFLRIETECLTSNGRSPAGLCPH